MKLLLSTVLALVGAQDAPRLELEDLSGKVTVVDVAGLDLADPRQRGAWILRPIGFPAPAEEVQPGAQAVVTLTDGDELRGRVRGGEGESIELELMGGVVLPIAVSGFVALDVPDRIPPDRRNALEPAAEGDRLYRRTGSTLDAIDGALEGFTAEGVRFDSVLGSKTFVWAEVAALRIEALDKDAHRAQESGVPVRVDFLDGSRLGGALKNVNAERCALVVAGQRELALPLAVIAQITVADGKLRYLSDEVPRAETGKGAPFGDELGLTWPHRMDANVLGGTLRAGGKEYRRGIGMHAPSALSFALDGKPCTLRGSVAIDDGARVNAPAARGAAVFRVKKDGAVAWESALVRGGDAPVAIPDLDLAGTKELVLEVDPAGDFAGDRADWLGIRLVAR